MRVRQWMLCTWSLFCFMDIWNYILADNNLFGFYNPTTSGDILVSAMKWLMIVFEGAVLLVAI